MYPKIYPLVQDLQRITVPVLLYGVGWSDPVGAWSRTHAMDFTSESRTLLAKIEGSGCVSSVRDYHTLNALAAAGFRRFVTTGCPALYDLRHLGVTPEPSPRILRVTFSPGTTFVSNPEAESVTKTIVESLRDAYKEAEITVAFHHSIDPEVFRRAYGSLNRRYAAQARLCEWLRRRGVPYVDLSGSHESMVEHYSACDFHVGFRVHAHLLMSSMSRPSILLAEDGRGIGLRGVVGGAIFDFYEGWRRGILSRKRRRAIVPWVVEDAVSAMRYEVANDFPRLRATRSAIDSLFPTMKRFLAALP